MSIGLPIMRLKCCQCQITTIIFPELFCTQPRYCQELKRKKCCIKTGTTKTAMPPPMQCFSSCVDPWIKTVYVTAGLGNIYPVVLASIRSPRHHLRLDRNYIHSSALHANYCRLLSCLIFFAVFCVTQMTNLGLAKMKLRSVMHQKHVFW